MTTEELINQISDHLQEVNADEKERVKRIDEMLDFLNWNKRITELTKSEKLAFSRAMAGDITEKERKLIADAADEKKEYYISSLARANYIKKCAWVSYLSGNGEKPVVLEDENH